MLKWQSINFGTYLIAGVRTILIRSFITKKVFKIRIMLLDFWILISHWNNLHQPSQQQLIMKEVYPLPKSNPTGDHVIKRNYIIIIIFTQYSHIYKEYLDPSWLCDRVSKPAIAWLENWFMGRGGEVRGAGTPVRFTPPKNEKSITEPGFLGFVSSPKSQAAITESVYYADDAMAVIV